MMRSRTVWTLWVDRRHMLVSLVSHGFVSLLSPGWCHAGMPILWGSERIGASTVVLYFALVRRMSRRSFGRDLGMCLAFFMTFWRNMLGEVWLMSDSGDFGCVKHARIISSAVSEAGGQLLEWLVSFLSFVILIASFLDLMLSTFFPPFSMPSDIWVVAIGGGGC